MPKEPKKLLSWADFPSGLKRTFKAYTLAAEAYSIRCSEGLTSWDSKDLDYYKRQMDRAEQRYFAALIEYGSD